MSPDLNRRSVKNTGGCLNLAGLYQTTQIELLVGTSDLWVTELIFEAFPAAISPTATPAG